MKVTKELNTNKGITLIALIITIIVMLILVGVTISMAVNGGLFNYAGKAVGETKNAIEAEQDLANGGITIDNTYYSSINEYLNKDKERISKTESYIGYYADVDGNGTVDGVIYADLAIGSEGNWGDSGGYSYESVTDVKDYYVSKTSYEGFFGTKDVLAPIGEGNDRFYVMALSDVSDSRYSWYNSKGEETLEVTTLYEFGTGKANTEAMIELWNSDTDEAKSSNDIWGQIQSQAEKGWFVPSSGEWAAFADVFDVYSEYDNNSEKDIIPYGLSQNYWTSSQAGDICTWLIDCGGSMIDVTLTEEIYIRLSTTF